MGKAMQDLIYSQIESLEDEINVLESLIEQCSGETFNGSRKDFKANFKELMDMKMQKRERAYAVMKLQYILMKYSEQMDQKIYSRQSRSKQGLSFSKEVNHEQRRKSKPRK